MHSRPTFLSRSHWLPLRQSLRLLLLRRPYRAVSGRQDTGVGMERRMSGYPDTTPSPPIRARCGSRDVGSHTALGGCGRMVIGDTGEDIMRACIGVLMSALLLVAAVTVSGCKSTGTGSGESRTGDVKATFTWEQTGPSQGTLHATVIDPGGNTDIYDGKFYQVTRDSRIETL